MSQLGGWLGTNPKPLANTYGHIKILYICIYIYCHNYNNYESCTSLRVPPNKRRNSPFCHKHLFDGNSFPPGSYNHVDPSGARSKSIPWQESYRRQPNIVDFRFICSPPTKAFTRLQLNTVDPYSCLFPPTEILRV